jgi:hypothetical protein
MNNLVSLDMVKAVQSGNVTPEQPDEVRVQRYLVLPRSRLVYASANRQ